MAEEVQSNIRVNIETNQALANLKTLQREISAFHTSMSKAGAASAAQASSLQNNLINSLNQTGKFAASFATVQTSAQAFTTALEKNKLSMGQYFKYAGAASKSFSNKFSQEFQTINNVAIERVKDLQTQYIKLGRTANGAIQTIKVRPLALDMDNLATKTAIAAQRQQILNQLLDQGSTKLLNFGKNMQWAGRQLMVGFTVPLSMFAGSAIKAFEDIEKQRVTLTRVYGDFNTTKQEADKAASAVQKLALQYTQYGVAVSDTMALGTTAAQAGAKGKDLTSQVAAASNLAVLGGIDQQQAFKTIMVLKNTFGLAGKELQNTVNLINAANNQTVLGIEDLTIAIPKAGPVVEQLGGNMKDLVFFMTAMREGGISASEGANALKSALSSMINPTQKAQDMLKGMGIDLRAIVQKDKGNLRATVMDFANALDTLDPLKRAQALEQLFGKFQFARVSALFNNITKAGSQAQTAANLGNASAGDLQKLADRELKKISSSPLYQFQKQLADLQANLAPIGESLMKFLIPIMKFFSDLAKGFQSLPDGMKTAIVGVTAVLGGLAPIVLMLIGLVANGAANMMKFLTGIKKFFNNLGTGSKVLGEQVKYLNQNEIDAAAQAASLDQVHQKLKQTFTSEAEAVDLLTAAYERAIAAQRAFSIPNTGGTKVIPKKYANGVFMVPGPKGAGDVVPAMLSPGEAVIPAAHVQKYGGLIQGMVAGNIPGYAQGYTGSSINASHTDQTFPEQFGKTISEIAKINKDLADWDILLTDIVRNEQGIPQEMTRRAKFSELSGKGYVVSGGVSYGGTTVPETRAKNLAYNVLRDSKGKQLSSPSTLDAVAEHGTIAQKKLDEYAASTKTLTEAQKQYIPELEKMVIAGKEANVLLSDSVNADESRIQYIRNYNKQMLKLGSVTSGLVKATEAEAYAEKKMADQDRILSQLKSEGISGQRLINEANSRYLGASIMSGATGHFVTTEEMSLSSTARDVGARKQLSYDPNKDYSGMNSRKQDRYTLSDPTVGRVGSRGMFSYVALNRMVEQEAMAMLNAVEASLASAGGAIVTEFTSAAKQLETSMKTELQIASPSKKMQTIGQQAAQGLQIGATQAIGAFGTVVREQMALALGPNAISPAMMQHIQEQFGKMMKPFVNPDGYINMQKLNEAQLKNIQIIKVQTAVTEAETAAEIINTEAKSGGMFSGLIGKVKGGLGKASTKISEAKSLGSFGARYAAGAAKSEGSAPGKLAALGLAASVAAGALSMIPGPIGEVVNSLMPMIMTVTSIVSILPLFGVSLAGLGTAILGMLGPIALVVGAIVGLTLLVNWSIDQQKIAAKKRAESEEKMYQSTQGLATALDSVSNGKGMKWFQSYFGTDLSTSPLSQYVSTSGSKTTSTTVAPTIADKAMSIQKDKSFLKENKDTIAALKKASENAAGVTLRQMARNLLSKGAAEEDVQAYIAALQNASGKTDLSLDFKNITFDKKGIARMVKDTNASISSAVSQTQNIPGFDKLMANQSIANNYRQFKGMFGKDQSWKNVSSLDANQKIQLEEAQKQGLVNVATNNGKKQFQMTSNAQTLYDTALTGKTTTYYGRGMSKTTDSGFGIAEGDNAAKMAAINTAASSAATTMDTLSAAFKNGKINSDTFNGALDGISSNMEKLEKVHPGATMQFMNTVLQKVPASARVAIQGVSGIKNQLILVKAAMLGLSIDVPAAAIKTGQAARKALTDTSKQGIANLSRMSTTALVGLQKLADAGDAAMKQLKADIKSQEKLMSSLTETTSTDTTPKQTKAEKRQAKYEKRSGIISDAESLLGKYADEVNKKYQDRINALQQVADLNQKITQAQQDQLGLAQALSKGDIAAAAQAAQTYRQNQANAEMQRQQKLMEEQQKSAVDALTVTVGGKKYTMQQLQDIQNRLDINNLTANLKGKKINFSTGGRIPSYFANGGSTIAMIPKGTDIVPAMLTPGEFIINAPAVKNFGVDNLRAINSGQSPAANGDSVYNYSINLNVSSNSDANDIANAVMNEIKKVDSQRIRGVRV